MLASTEGHILWLCELFPQGTCMQNWKSAVKDLVIGILICGNF